LIRFRSIGVDLVMQDRLVAPNQLAVLLGNPEASEQERRVGRVSARTRPARVTGFVPARTDTIFESRQNPRRLVEDET